MINYTFVCEDFNRINEAVAFPPTKLDYPIHSSTAFCPALKKNKDWWVIRAPYTYHLKHEFLEDGESQVSLLPRSNFRDNVFEKVIRIEPKDVRNQKNIPLIQFLLNTTFWTKEKDVTIEAFPAFMSHKLNKQPLVSIYGSYPISNWMRPLNFAFDWVEPDKEILIERGDPLLYVRFSKKLPLKFVPQTPELYEKMKTCAGMANHYHSQDWKWMFKHMGSLLWK
jgi:hypothetical protein